MFFPMPVPPARRPRRPSTSRRANGPPFGLWKIQRSTKALRSYDVQHVWKFATSDVETATFYSRCVKSTGSKFFRRIDWETLFWLSALLFFFS